MAKRKRHNPEKRAWEGRSYKKGGKRVSSLRKDIEKAISRHLARMRDLHLGVDAEVASLRPFYDDVLDAVKVNSDPR